MAEQLKEMFNGKFFDRLGDEFKKVYKKFNKDGFTTEINIEISDKSLNERMRLASVLLRKYLPDDFEKTMDIMKDVIPNMPKGYTNLLFPDYVSVYGLQNYKTSLTALHYFTKFGSSEFAIRVFLKNDFQSTIKQMYNWSEDENYHVRRLSSEGSRPRLPWSFKLDEVIMNPKLTMPILEILKQDPEVYVQKSVANHLNDVSKEHPKFIYETIKRWQGLSRQTDWIIKHGSRTLLKSGDEKVLTLFGTGESKSILINNIKLEKTKIEFGNSINFGFEIENTSKKNLLLRIEFALYFLKANGSYTKKVFKISEKEIEGNSIIAVNKSYAIKPITTRVYYSGTHYLTIIVNGKESDKKSFILKNVF